MTSNGSIVSAPRDSFKYALAALSALVLLTAQPAQAGFRYVAPQQQAAPMMAPAVTPTGLMPQGAVQNGMVQGFADSVPLTVALRQILPRGMAFRVANDVDTTTPVSWRGGRAWQQTLDDMVASAGLQASYGQNGVVIQRGAMVMESASMAPVTLTPPASIIMPAATPSYEPSSMMPMNTPQAQASGYAANEAPPQIIDLPAQQPQPQPYVAPASTGVAATVPDTNATIGAQQQPLQQQDYVQQPVQEAMGTLPEGTVGELPQQTVPGTDVGTLPAMETSALNPLAPAPADVAASSTGGSIAAGSQAWEAHSGQNLHEVLEAWSQRAGIELNWVSEYDYPMQASLTYNGTFEEAVRTLLGGFVNASPQPIGRLHRNEQLGQQALIIETRGNQYDE